MFIGSSDSPMWKRGCRAFSSSVTCRPARASSVAAVEPAGPPPITRTSVASTALGLAGVAQGAFMVVLCMLRAGVDIGDECVPLG